MCGIAGIVTREPLLPEQIGLVAHLNARLIHRGPDGGDEFHDSHVALATRRLSIIDVTGGWQPLHNEDRSLALVANGEVYNFIELRRELEQRGHRFATRSDCETILHLYEEHGDRCVDYLRGMFAFALWDSRRKRLLLARDRGGEKPLYLVQKDRQIIFASELKALIGARAVPFALDPAAVHMYYHYAYVPEPETAIAGVRKLPAGHLLTVDVARWQIEQRCYWRMEDAPPINVGDSDPPKIISRQLEEISELIIRSDVPVGVALSGGLDSSAIAALAAKNYPGTLQAISVGYPGRPIQDERNDARMLADHLRVPFHEVELSAGDMVEMLPQVVFARDDPIYDLAGVGYYVVAKQARELGVPVMLFGHGGDELFWGYSWVRQAASDTRRKAALLANGATGVRDYLKLAPFPLPLSYTAGLRWFKSVGGLWSGLRQYRRDRTGPAGRYVFYDLTPGFDVAQSELGDLYTARFRHAVRDVDPFAPFTQDQPLPSAEIAITRLIFETYLRENGLAQGDRLSMAHSVEARQPLVDYRLVETVIGLRKTLPDLHLGAKHWLREAVKHTVPGFVLARRKRGFSSPWRSWARARARAFGHLLTDGYLASHGIIKPQSLKSLTPRPLGLQMHLAEESLLLEMWCRQMSEYAGATASRATSHFHRD
ncbi:MAG: asparagine synthase (glutamine-hydrolyzing) [Gammaproteobacteria bacterium]